MRGRKPTPTALKVLRGNPGKRTLNKDEAAPDAHDLVAPEWLDDEAKAEWNRLGPMLSKLGLLSEIDGNALANYCMAWSRWKEAEGAIRKHGMVIKGKGDYPVKSPYVGIAEKAMAQMKTLLVEFGMTPSARSRVHVRPSQVVSRVDRFRNAKHRIAG